MQEEFDKKTLHDKIREVTQFPLLDIGFFSHLFPIFLKRDHQKIEFCRIVDVTSNVKNNVT